MLAVPGSVMALPAGKTVNRAVHHPKLTKHSSNGGGVPVFKDIDRQMKISLTEPSPSKLAESKHQGHTPTVSDDGYGDDNIAAHGDGPVVAHSATSPTGRKS